MSLRFAILFGICIFLALSCTTTNNLSNEKTAGHEPLSRHGNPPYYSVAGKRYFPIRDSKNYNISGLASWYGKAFHGQRTANGEVFDRFAFTAAHKTLPLPSFVEVTNLANHRSVIVRVNDRGPFHGDRLIDLSYAAAKQLGFAEKGIAKVNIRALAVSRGKSDSHAFIQIGAFRELAMAEQFKIQFSQLQAPLPTIILPAKDWYRVQVGPLKDLKEVNTAVEVINEKGITNWFFVSSR